MRQGPAAWPQQQQQQQDRPTPLILRPRRAALHPPGSVATIKLPLLAALLAQLGELRLAATSAARTFVHLEQLPPGLAPPAGDEDEWRDWAAVGDPVLHIELRRWADVFVVAPLSANSLAKLAQGLCDNLVTCVARAWDFRRPLLVRGRGGCCWKQQVHACGACWQQLGSARRQRCLGRASSAHGTALARHTRSPRRLRRR